MNINSIVKFITGLVKLKGGTDNTIIGNSSDSLKTTNTNASGASAVNIQDGGNSITVDATSLPLPTGASTSALQTTGNTTLSTIATELTDKSQFTKITDGTDTVKVTTNSNLSVSDGLRNGGVQGNLNLVTANTAYEAKVGGSRLSNRKSLTVHALADIYWGYDNTVTTSTGTPISNNQVWTWAIDPDSTFQIWLVSSANNKNARITESP
jgi:hypothetical protein